MSRPLIKQEQKEEKEEKNGFYNAMNMHYAPFTPANTNINGTSVAFVKEEPIDWKPIDPQYALGYRMAMIQRFRLGLESNLDLQPPEFDFRAYVQSGNFDSYPLFYDNQTPNESDDNGDPMRRFLCLFKTSSFVLTWCWKMICFYCKKGSLGSRITFWQLMDNKEVRSKFFAYVLLERYGISVDNGVKATTHRVVNGKERAKQELLDWFDKSLTYAHLHKDDGEEALAKKLMEADNNGTHYRLYMEYAKKGYRDYTKKQKQSNNDNDLEIVNEKTIVIDNKSERRMSFIKRIIFHWISLAGNLYIPTRIRRPPPPNVVPVHSDAIRRGLDDYEGSTLRYTAQDREVARIYPTATMAETVTEDREDIRISQYYDTTMSKLCDLGRLDYRTTERRFLSNGSIQTHVFFCQWAAMIVHRTKQFKNQSTVEIMINNRINDVERDIQIYFQGWCNGKYL
jgi:hypothetical protein